MVVFEGRLRLAGRVVKDDNVPRLPTKSLNTSRAKAGLVENKDISENKSNAHRRRKRRADCVQQASSHWERETKLELTS